MVEANRPGGLRALVLGVGLVWMPAHAASSIVLDGSLKAGTANSVLLASGTVASAGTIYNKIAIPESLGSRAGRNVFQSFSQFSIDRGDAAVFTISSPANNVISRVTGGQGSTIYGLLKLDPGTTGSAPNFYFINPAGVTFGAGATVDVPGAMHVSTANYLKFADGNFHADTVTPSALSIAEPEAFGFLGSTRGEIVVGGSTNANVRIASRYFQPVSLIGGDIVIDGAVVNPGLGGDARIAAVGTPAAEIPVSGTLPPTFGNFNMLGNASIVVSGDGTSSTGNVAVSAGTLTIDPQGRTGDIGIITIAESQGASRSAGNIYIGVTGSFALRRNGRISVLGGLFSTGYPGSIRIAAGTLAVDGGSISSTPNGLSTGNAGTIDITTSNTLSVTGSGSIVSGTASSGNAGAINIRAGNVSIDGGLINSNSRSAGAAGNIGITTTGTFSVVNGSLEAATTSTGNAGNVDVTASGPVFVGNGGTVISGTFGTGNAGSIRINTPTLTVNGMGGTRPTGILASTAAAGNGGPIDLTVGGTLSLLDGGRIVSSTRGAGPAGRIGVTAGTVLIANGEGRASLGAGILSETDYGIGRAGEIDLSVGGLLSIANGGRISSSTGWFGNAGSIRVLADAIAIDGKGTTDTGLYSKAMPESVGRAGAIVATARNAISIVGRGGIDTSTSAYSEGNAGSVSVSANSVSIEGIGSHISSSTSGTGDAGSVAVTATQLMALRDGGQIQAMTRGQGKAGSARINAGTLIVTGNDDSRAATGVFSETRASSGRGGDAGTIEVTVGDSLSMSNGAQIGSDTYTTGNAGGVRVNAGSIVIDGSGRSQYLTAISSDANPGSTGRAGSVEVAVAGNLSLVNSGIIDSSTSGLGNAGTVSVRADSVVIDGANNLQSATGILSNTDRGSGNAGSVSVSAASAVIVKGTGEISASTWGPGRAGAVAVTARTVLIDGAFGDYASRVGARAGEGSSGQTGNVTVTASESIALANGGDLSIANDATVPNAGSLTPTLLTVAAPSIVLRDASITASSSGNVAASNIRMSFSRTLSLDPSAITTSSNLGNGGAIRIDGASGALVLDNSQITTSVAGRQGSGGDIDISVRAIALKSGFIQANTAAANAPGGDINIEAQAVLPFGNAMFVGGSAPYAFRPGIPGFNIIQAAAPTGVSGAITLSSPALDISGSVAHLPAQMLDSAVLGQDLCKLGTGSSMTLVGHGAIPPSARDFIRPELR